MHPSSLQYIGSVRASAVCVPFAVMRLSCKNMLADFAAASSFILSLQVLNFSSLLLLSLALNGDGNCPKARSGASRIPPQDQGGAGRIPPAFGLAGGECNIGL